MVDKYTELSLAVFLGGESTQKVRDAFLYYWLNLYLGCSNEVVLDQGHHPKSIEFRSLLSAALIRSVIAGVESNNALGEIER